MTLIERILNKAARTGLTAMLSVGIFPAWSEGARRRLWMYKLYSTFEKKVSAALYPDGQPVVLSGPFEGMKFLKPPVYGKITARWFGCYEEQLHEITRQIIATAYPTIIDVGSSEGYYAVGFARALPKSTIHAYDTDPYAQTQLRKLAALNNCTNVVQSGYCSHEEVTRLTRGPTFILVDIESFEHSFLDPSKCPAFLQADILVEGHMLVDVSHEKLVSDIADRFRATHDIQLIPDAPRDVAKYRAICGSRLADEDIAYAIGEERGIAQTWIWMKRKGG